jgi:protoporphyrinogen/coproporphyrinogen III oxidase
LNVGAILNTYCFYILLEDGFLWEEGPNSFQPTPSILRFAKDLELLDDIVLAEPGLPRYIYWEGKLHALPSSLKQFFATGLLTC